MAQNIRNKNFVLGSIKMDLQRVVTATGDPEKPLQKDSAEQFLKHALSDFDKIQATHHQNELKKQLTLLLKHLEKEHPLTNKQERLHWAEKILTIRCRL